MATISAPSTIPDHSDAVFTLRHLTPGETWIDATGTPCVFRGAEEDGDIIEVRHAGSVIPVAWARVHCDAAPLPMRDEPVAGPFGLPRDGSQGHLLVESVFVAHGITASAERPERALAEHIGQAGVPVYVVDTTPDVTASLARFWSDRA